eukprot:144098-Pyramimonas_sp.AAC.1
MTTMHPHMSEHTWADDPYMSVMASKKQAEAALTDSTADLDGLSQGAVFEHGLQVCHSKLGPPSCQGN